MFPDLTVALGGQTGIDIGPKGADKSQILRDFDKDDEIIFYGDMMEEGENDYPLAKAVEEMGGRAHKVNTWKDTWELLKKEKECASSQTEPS